jgi:hypothetical protein
MFGCLGLGSTEANQTNKTSIINQSNSTDCICPSLYQPVCGTDDKTYANTCIAKCYNISVRYDGACGQPTCSDSDNGKNSSVKGTAKSSGLEFTDYCTVFSSVEEYYCNNLTVGKETIVCERGYECRNGACVLKVEEAGSNCTDSDSKSVYTKGITNSSDEIYTDDCTEYKSVLEYYCEDKKVKSTSIVCPATYKCDDGSCVRIGSNCVDTDSGRDIDSGGRVKVIVELTTAEYLDKCLDGDTVLEYYCSSGDFKSEAINCPLGYRCVAASCQEDKCFDTDEGDNIYRKGAVNKGASIYRDMCTSSYSGIEYYCEGNEIGNRTFVCPHRYKCEDGVCVD